MSSRTLGARGIVLATALSFAAAPLMGAGFGIFEQGSKAMGMAGAFTATADDPSAMFHNPAGLAFQEDQEVYAGPTLIYASSEFDGANPYPGETIHEEQKSALFTPISLYYAHGSPSGFAWGLAVNTPFGLATEWEHPDTYTGRFISQRAELQSVSVQPTVAFRFGDDLAIGLGAEYRYTVVELERNVPTVNPFTQRVVDIAHVDLESDGVNGDWGFTAGILWKLDPAFRIGASYRHHIDVDIDGKGQFTQVSTGNAELDAIIAAQIPFGESLDVETGIAFPSMASFGIAIDPTPDMTVEANANWTGWSRFEDVVIGFPDHAELSSTIPQEWENEWNFRLGIEKRYGTHGCAVRLGYVYDKSPQPRSGIGPLLPDRDRAGYTVGLGQDKGKWGYDIAYMYLDFREADSMGENRDGYNGSYDTKPHLLGLHLRYNF